jgi:hypothetical protein
MGCSIRQGRVIKLRYCLHPNQGLHFLLGSYCTTVSAIATRMVCMSYMIWIYEQCSGVCSRIL